MSDKYLDHNGLAYFWGKLKSYFQEKLVSGTNIKTVNNQSLLGSGDITIQGGGAKNIWYGTCTTGSATAQKVVSTSSGDFELTTGSMVRVRFGSANTYDGTATLNVDGTGAKNIARVGSDLSTRYYWVAGEVVDFVYDGTRFVMSAKGKATTTYYGLTKLSSSHTSTETNVAATPSAVKAAYDLAADSTDVPTAGKKAEFDANAHMNSADMTAQDVSDFVDGLNVSGATLVDYIVEQGTDGIWTYRKWNSGLYEAWTSYDATELTLTTSSAGTYYSSSGYKNLALPSFSLSVANVLYSNRQSQSSGVYVYDTEISGSNLRVWYRAHASASNANCGAYFEIKGRWK